MGDWLTASNTVKMGSVAMQSLQLGFPPLVYSLPTAGEKMKTRQPTKWFSFWTLGAGWCIGTWTWLGPDMVVSWQAGKCGRWSTNSKHVVTSNLTNTHHVLHQWPNFWTTASSRKTLQRIDQMNQNNLEWESDASLLWEMWHSAFLTTNDALPRIKSLSIVP